MNNKAYEAELINKIIVISAIENSTELNSASAASTNEPVAQKDSREDSILYRPRTETYETKRDDETFDIINRFNPSHAVVEQKRDEINRKKKSKRS